MILSLADNIYQSAHSSIPISLLKRPAAKDNITKNINPVKLFDIHDVQFV